MKNKILSWDEIRKKAYQFQNDWKDATSEKSDKQTFYNEFFEVFGVNRRKATARYESRVKKRDGHFGDIDLFWRGKLVVEHKSRGGDLDKAHLQALEYIEGLDDEEKPRFILVSDFEKFVSMT